MSFAPFSFSSVPAGGVATSAMSMVLLISEKNLSPGSARSRSGSHRSAGSICEAKRIFMGGAMVAFGAEEISMKRARIFLCLIFFGSTAAVAQDWPKQRPIHLVVAFGPGATTDLVARLGQPRLAEAFGQSVIVENKTGAGGNVGAQQVKRAAPDGYTLLVTSFAFAVNPRLYENAGYEIKDFAPVLLGPSTPKIITVNPAVKPNNLQELIELARKEKLSYASSGIGTTTHLSMERIKPIAKLDITHVPYQPAQAVGAAVAGHTQISRTSVPPGLAHARAGRVRALAGPSRPRSPAPAGDPTLDQQGESGFVDPTWTAFFAPAGQLS